MDKETCSQHLKTVLGESDMKKVAEAIGDLHYETLAELFESLSSKFYIDAAKDRSEGRRQIANELEMLANNIEMASIDAEAAWKISKPFMKP